MQTMKEYRKFSPDSVNGSINTNGLLHNLESSNDKKIVVTTIQKLNRLVARENSLSIYDKQVVLIFDEAHRSQFNEAQKNITRRFKKYYQFGFTGTPIFSDNALDDKTTESVFGKELHSYVITDAIRDEKVLKFKVDYHDVRPKFKSFEIEQDEKKLSSAETKQALLNPERIKEIAQYILANFKQKTHRLHGNNKGFNAMFAVSSVDAAKLYYEAFKKLQTGVANPLKIATIFSYASNEEQASICDIADESLDLDVAAIDMSAKEFLDVAISDYNNMFKTNYSTDAEKFQNYYSNVSERVKKREIDLIIVVGMFLTGFDAKTLNTLFVDKNLRYHGLIQAYSRTNRIYDATKSFGNIVTFRNLESATIDAIRLFGESNTRNIILEKSYQEHMEGFTNILTNEVRRGYLNIVAELQEKFPNHDEIITEKDKKEFTKLFGEYLRAENILQNYDEFVALKALQHIDRTNNNAVEKFKNQYYVSDEDFNTMSKICLPNDRCIQNYRSTYNDIREWLQREKAAQNESKSTLDWDDVTFEVELLKSQKINLDYILELLFEKNKDIKDKALLIEDIRLIIRSSLDNPHQEDLIVKFINQTNLDDIISQENILEAFYTFAQQEQQDEFEHLISVEDLNRDETKRYIEISLKRQYASEHGTELSKILPKMSKVDPQYKTKKQKVFQKVSVHIEKYKNIGRSINY
jgi:type I restriction enzyme R subunit